MAGGWSKDGAVQDQIDASVADAVNRARTKLNRGKSLSACEVCDAAIPLARQKAIIGVGLCITCQELADHQDTETASLNRRGSKGSQMR